MTTRTGFDIRDVIDRLTPAEGKNRYICPVCKGNDLTVAPNDGAYKCWHGCECRDIREAISPRYEVKGNGHSPRPSRKRRKSRGPAPAPIPDKIELAQLPQIPSDRPCPEKPRGKPKELPEGICQAHWDEWSQNSAVKPEITAKSIESIEDKQIIADFLGWKAYQGDKGWWCKSVDVRTNKPIKFGQFKPDKPIQFPDREKPAKYLTPKQPLDAIALPVIDWPEVVKDPTIPIDLTEGGKKAGCLLSLERTALSLTGVWNQDIDAEIAGIKTKKLCPNLDALAVPHRVFNLVFDSDFIEKDSVLKALIAQAKKLINRQCLVNVIIWDKSLGKGIDDVMVQNPDRIAEILGNPIKFKDWLKSLEDQFSEDKPNKAKRNEIKKVWHILHDDFVSRLKFNELKMTVELDGELAELEDFYLDLAIDYGILMPKNTAYDLAVKFAKEHAYHPVKDYLNSISEKNNLLDLDIRQLASRYLGTDNPLYDEMLYRHLIGSIARVFNKGCKKDEAIILQGKQGIGKSTFWRLLYGDNFFTDSLTGTERDDLLILHQFWCCELAEFDFICSRKQAGELKAFLSRQSDTFREPYARTSKERKRQSVIVGSVNENEFLIDNTGNRRFWVIPVKSVKLDLLGQERDLIWALAYQAYKQGEKHYLSWEYEKFTSNLNEQYLVSDPWEETILSFIENMPKVTISQIFENLHFDENKRERKHQNRIVKILTQNGWKKEGRQYYKSKYCHTWVYDHCTKNSVDGHSDGHAETIDNAGVDHCDHHNHQISKNLKFDPPEKKETEKTANFGMLGKKVVKEVATVKHPDSSNSVDNHPTDHPDEEHNDGQKENQVHVVHKEAIEVEKELSVTPVQLPVISDQLPVDSNPLPTPLTENCSLIEPDHAKYAEQLEAIKKAPLLSLDIETYGEKKREGLHPWRGKIRLIQLGLPDTTYICDLGGRLEDREQRKQDLAEFFEVLRETIQNPEQLIVGHNLLFDLRFLATQYGIRQAQNVACTLLGLQVYFGDAPSNSSTGKKKHEPIFKGGYGLANAVEKLLGVQLDKTYQTSDFGQPLTPEQLSYATSDAYWALKLYEKLEEIYQDKSNQFYSPRVREIWSLENQVIAPTIEVELAGLPLDTEELERQKTRLLEISSSLEEEWQQLVPGIKYTQRDKLLQHLNEHYKLNLNSLTKADLANHKNNPVVTLRRKLEAISVKLNQLEAFERSAGRDGRVHTIYRTLTGFGRFSSGGGNCSAKADNDLPNLQSIGAKSDPILFEYDLPSVRKCIRPEPGKVMAVIDLAGAHGRIAADQAADPVAIAGNNDPSVDNHSKVAAYIASAQGFDWDWEYIKTAKEDKSHPDHKQAKSFRDTAKNTYYGWLNGAGAERIQEQITANTGQKPSLEDCQAAIAGCVALYPKVVEFRKALMKDLKQSSVTVFGQPISVNAISDGSRICLPLELSRYHPDKLEPAYTQNLACIWSRIEATAMKNAFIQVGALARQYPEWELKVINVVHDELDLEVNCRYATDAITAANNIVGDCFKAQLKYVEDGRETDWKKLTVKSWADK